MPVSQRAENRNRFYVRSFSSKQCVIPKQLTMKFGAFFCFFIIGFAQAKVTQSNSFTTRIINGTNAHPGEFPHQVSVQIDQQHICGGSIINKNYVLSASHCFTRNYSQSSYRILAGTLKLSKPGSIHHIQKIIIHDSYNSFTDENDIALLKVINHFVFSDLIKPVPLPKFNTILKDKQKAVVSGWGLIYFEKKIRPNHLQRTDLLIRDQKISCGIHFYDTKLCAHYPNAWKGPCYGDSGGPLTANGILVGIVSHGFKNYQCGHPNNRAIFTKVSKYLDWITDNAL